jgi:hypothetical protein
MQRAGNELERNRAVCAELGLHHWQTNPSGVEFWRCQVVGLECLACLVPDGWWMFLNGDQRALEGRWSTLDFGPTKLEAMICTKA